MTVAPTWSILVPTLGERAALFERLMAGLMPQVDAAGGRVRVVGWFNNGTPSLPEIRQSMVYRATTDYVSFVDDDDVVAPYFVDEVLAAMSTRPDYVGFQVQCYSDGAPTAVAYHSLAHNRWVNTPGRFLRDISHINPMRARLARQADFRRARAGRAEDRVWVDQLRRLRVLRSEVVIPRIVYHYLYSTNRTAGLGSRWERPAGIFPGADRPEISSPYFTWAGDLPDCDGGERGGFFPTACGRDYVHVSHPLGRPLPSDLES